MTSREKHLERVHIIRTLINYGPLTAVEVADRANSECDHDAFDDLPPISRRGITAKLNSLGLKGLVAGAAQIAGGPVVWRVTGEGVAASEVFETQEKVREYSLRLANTSAGSGPVQERMAGRAEPRSPEGS